MKIFSYIFSIFKKNDDESESLNGLRAVAIILVIIFHIWTVFKTFYFGSWKFLSNVFDNFNSGVDLFFILSGYLIYGGFLRNYKKFGSLNIQKFFINRALRILPAFYFALFIVYSFSRKQIDAMIVNPPSDPGILHFWQAQAKILEYVWSDIFFISNYFPHVLIVDWSLSVENHFYILLPFFCALGLIKIESRNRIFIFGILYLLPGISRLYGAYSGLPYSLVHETHNRFDSILVGMIVAELILIQSVNLSVIRLRIIGAVSVFLLVIGHCFPIESWIGKSLSLNMQNIGYGLLTFLCLNPNTFWDKIFSWVIFRPIARVSYSMYLWNITTIGVGAGLVAKNRNNLSPLVITEIIFLSILVTFIASWALYLLVEKPFADWKNRLRKVR